MSLKRAWLLFFRNAKANQKLFLIKLAGFSIGVIASLFIYIYEFKELSVDRFHSKHKDIYRVISSSTINDLKNSSEFLPLGDLLKRTYPEVIDYARIWEEENTIMTDTNEPLKNQHVWFVDPSFFELFDFRLSVGDYKQLFDMPDGIILTEKIASTLFEGQDPIGKIVEMEAMPGEVAKKYTVIGILKKYPQESTLQPLMVANIESKIKKYSHYNQWALSSWLFLYIPEFHNNSQIASQIPSNILDEIKQTTDRFLPNLNSVKYELQPLANIYLHSSEVNDRLLKGNLLHLKIFSIVGFVFLLITSLNYVILSLGANSNDKRFGHLHYALGGSSSSLLKSIVIDSVIFTCISFVVIMLLYPYIYKIIVAFTGYRYNLFVQSDWLIFSTFFLILLLFSALSGWLQYLYIDKLSHNKIVIEIVNKRQHLFYGLIQFQLVLFISTFVSLFFINRQIHYLKNADLGFDSKNTYCLSSSNINSQDFLKQELKKLSYVTGISSGEYLFRNVFSFQKIITVHSDKIVESQVIQGDHEYLDVYGINLLEGKNLSKSSLSTMDEFFDEKRREGIQTELIVNKEFVRQAGLKYPVGTVLKSSYSFNTGQIIGVFDDVKNLPLHYSKKPIVIGYDFRSYPFMLNVLLASGYEKQFLSDLKNIYEKEHLGPFSSLRILHYNFEQQYEKEQKVTKLISLFSIIALTEMILGLVGLSLYVSEMKIKEIGIRKINGAKVSEVIVMLNRNVVKWVVVSFIIATPIAYYSMNKWLQNFAYKTSLSWWVFAMAGVLALAIALLTVSWQSWKAATRNPVEALRYE